MPMTSGADGGEPTWSAEPTNRERARIRRDVLSGSARLWRELPWRETRDPWRVLVSEVMLQQTQAPRVVEPFGRFVARFPAPVDCADAGAAEVVRAWAGLGYNRRALNLHRAALAIVERHDGRVPDQLGALLDLPGVGPYTARAVLAFAYGYPIGVVDTNVLRVLARAVAGRPLGTRAAQRLADRLVPSKDAWRFNQALFDLGAGCCTARSPRCGTCPLARRCRWHAARSVGVRALGPVGSPGRLAPDIGDVPDAAAAAAADPAAVGRRRQSTFAGSDRQGRGRLVCALRAAPLHSSALARASGWPDDPARALRVAAALVEDGLACWRGGTLALA